MSYNVLYISILHVIQMTNVSYIGNHVTRGNKKNYFPLPDRKKSFDLLLDLG
jgi:hypothetical protein